MAEILTFCQWLSHNCSLTEEQLRLVSLEYGEDSVSYIESKHYEYIAYLRKQTNQ
jgi:hypothetical protein